MFGGILLPTLYFLSWKSFYYYFNLFLAMGLFRLLNSSCYNVGGLAKSKNSAINFMFFSLMEMYYLKYSFIISWISLVSVEMFLCLCLIVLVWVVSIFLLVSWASRYINLIYLFKEPVLSFVNSLNSFLFLFYWFLLWFFKNYSLLFTRYGLLSSCFFSDFLSSSLCHSFVLFLTF